MPGVGPFLFTPQTSGSNTAPHVADRHDGDQSVYARQAVWAEVYSDQGFNSPNGQVGATVCRCMDFEQLNEPYE